MTLKESLEKAEGDFKAAGETISKLEADAKVSSESIEQLTANFKAEQEKSTKLEAALKEASGNAATAGAELKTATEKVTKLESESKSADERAREIAARNGGNLPAKDAKAGNSLTGTGDNKVMARADFTALNAAARSAFCKAGGKLTD